MNFCIFGAGYVGLSLATMLARTHSVCLIENDEQKIKMISNRKSPIKDTLIESYFEDNHLNLVCCSLKDAEILKADYIVLALPTNFNTEKNYFDTLIVENVLKLISNITTSIPVIIKSTVPVGFCDRMVELFGFSDLVFSPEFLREGNALYDNLYPSRLIVGSNSAASRKFVETIENCSAKLNIVKIFTDNRTAELIKLSANSYLAARISFFNEIDQFALNNGIEMSEVVKGISADPRIGEGYNNPSFAFGGYCLPKDTKQLYSSFQEYGIEAPLIGSITESNRRRIEGIIQYLLKLDLETYGIFRLQMKNNSDNFREAANLKVVAALLEKKRNVVIYEPNSVPSYLEGLKIPNLNEFCEKSDIIIANRSSASLSMYARKVFTRDIFNEN